MYVSLSSQATSMSVWSYSVQHLSVGGVPAGGVVPVQPVDPPWPPMPPVPPLPPAPPPPQRFEGPFSMMLTLPVSPTLKAVERPCPVKPIVQSPDGSAVALTSTDPLTSAGTHMPNVTAVVVSPDGRL